MAEFEERWAPWLVDDGPISGTVHRLMLDRTRWWRLRSRGAAEPQIPDWADTIGWFWYHYASDAAVRIRRLADEDKRSASLGRVLVEVRAAAPSLTRERFLARWHAHVSGGIWESFAREQAEQWFGTWSGDGVTVDAARVESDLEHLRAAVKPVTHFVDKRLAHHNPEFEPALTYEEISTAIDVVGELFRRYSRLVRQVEPMGLTDITQWGEAFLVPWGPLPDLPNHCQAPAWRSAIV